ncbi:M1 family aminopeptidase [Anthocerotibacter panamensis]|uniref:M1 family aminopeptidase n=1 Tax=Anthocerotibacter panamensis TaxID=2857077 RepID=UPI001C4072BF|nr:M1 family aminopeptidase [Anthocerotibacter panamensis]
MSPSDHAQPYKTFPLPGSKPQYSPDKPGRVQHIALDLSLDIAGETLTGTCAVRLLTLVEGLRTLTLDAVAMQIQGARLGQEPLLYAYDGTQLRLTLPEGIVSGQTLECTVDYCVAKPRRGIYFVKPDAHYPDKPVQVWTQGEDEDARFWFPCFDYPEQLATSEIRVSVPQPYRAISNGILVEERATERTTIFHWKQQQVHPCYLMTLVVGEFSEIVDGWDGISTLYYVTPGQEAVARLTLGKTPRMVAFFSEKFGVRYPYPRYAQVCVADYIFGGMENTSCTLLTDRALLDEQAAQEPFWPEDLVSHELVHQWFGDLVVIRHWSHAWIKEGAATYGEVLWQEHEYGPEEAVYYRWSLAHEYFTEDEERYRRPIVTNVYKEAIELFDRHTYQKGALVYHMVRHYLGDKLFSRVIQTFLEDNRHCAVETIDLLRAIEKATGRNFLPLFEQYVFKGGHPDFKVAYTWVAEGSYAKVTVQQTQVINDLTGLFTLEVPIALGWADGTSQTLVLAITQKEQTFCFPLATKPLWFSFDPGNDLLKTLELTVSVEDLLAQLRHDPSVMGRVFAAHALAKKVNPIIVAALQEVLLDPAVFWGVRAECADALGSTHRDYAFAVLRAALTTIEDSRVLEAVLDALGEDPSALTFEAAAPLLKHNSYQVSAQAAETVGKSRAKGARKLLKKTLKQRDSWNEVVRVGAVNGLAHLKDDPKARNLLLKYTQLGVPQALRLKAIRALGRFGENQEDPRILEGLTTIAREEFFLTRVATIAALRALRSPRALELLEQLAQSDPDGRVERSALEALEATRQAISQSQEIKNLRETVTELQKLTQELKSRCDILEANHT